MKRDRDYLGNHSQREGEMKKILFLSLAVALLSASAMAAVTVIFDANNPFANVSTF